MRNTWHWLGAIWTLGLCDSAAAPGSEASCGPLRVGVREYPEIYMRQPDGQFTGLDRDFFAALAEHSGCVFDLQLESQPRIWVRLENGSLDMASWVIQNEQRKAIVTVVPLLSVHLMAVLRRELGPISQG